MDGIFIANSLHICVAASYVSREMDCAEGMASASHGAPAPIRRSRVYDRDAPSGRRRRATDTVFSGVAESYSRGACALDAEAVIKCSTHMESVEYSQIKSQLNCVGALRIHGGGPKVK
jgi:hypothetical protein